jgi:GntR family transcriptional regulator/MocR family aminotransferase
VGVTATPDMSRDPAVMRDGLVAVLSVTLDRASAEPLVRQLYRHVRELILTQRLRAGARLPSTRSLSRDLQVSRTVALDAFGQLAAEGFLESRRGAGHFVAELRLPVTDAAAPRRLSPEPERPISSPSGRPFDAAWQAVDLFPGQVWSRMLGRAWRRHQIAAMQRHWAGLPVLRETLAHHLHALRGVPLTDDEIIITSGNADALTLIARAFGSGSSRRAWVEDPGFAGSSRVFGAEGLEIVPVPVDAEGLDVGRGEQLAPDAALALVTATRQFPLGMPLTLPRRLALLEWARRSGAVIVDDDYDSEIRFSGRPLQTLAGLDPAARVLTIGSFSKLTFPGLRLGYAAGPSGLIGALVEQRRTSQALVETSGQAAFAEFVSTGGFARHLRRLRTYLVRRRHLVVEALRTEVGDLVDVLPQEVGMHVTVRLNRALDERIGDVVLAERASRRGLVVMPLSEQYSNAAREPGFLLGYAGWSEAELRAAIGEFAALLREAASS